MAQSHACCTVPPVVSKGYKEKGDWITIDGMKTYRTGPTNAKSALLVIYDIFGYFPQTLQGADILAHADAERQYQVFMPDFFEGNPVPIDWYPPDTKEKGENLGEFFSTTGAPPKTVTRVPKVVDAITAQYPGIQEWGIVGFCWGGKVVNLSSQSGTKFKAAAACHPAMIDPGDAPGVTIPYCMIPTMDEDREAVEKWQQGIKTESTVRWFDDQVHGFMAARGNLEDGHVREQYEAAYKILLDFFHENM